MAAPVGKRTAKLLREAIVLAHVHGARWGRYYENPMDQYPSDSSVVEGVLRAARANKDLYPTLGRLSERLASQIPKPDDA
jgi:hypothetical protein